MDYRELKKYLPHLWVFVGFCTTILVLFIIIDSYILPAVIHGSDKVTVPNVTGMKLQDAILELETVDLNFRKATEQYNEDYPANCVINQFPRPNTIVNTGRHVNLTISKGGESITMPDVVHRPLRFARVALMQRGLYIGNIDYTFNDSIGVDTIISQSKSSGRNITFGSYIDLIVSKGAMADIKVPDLIGKTLAEAEGILEGLHLQLGGITNNYEKKYASTYMRNTIVNQFPIAEEIVAKNTKIDITLFR